MKEERVHQYAEERVQNMLEHYAGACEHAKVSLPASKSPSKTDHIVKWEPEHRVTRKKTFEYEDMLEFFEDTFSPAGWGERIDEWEKKGGTYHVSVVPTPPFKDRIWSVFSSLKQWYLDRFTDYNEQI
jgi:hypothetical protein